MADEYLHRARRACRPESAGIVAELLTIASALPAAAAPKTFTDAGRLLDCLIHSGRTPGRPKGAAAGSLRAQVRP